MTPSSLAVAGVVCETSGVGPADPLLKLERLRALLDDLGPVIVAFSGGADSAFLAAVAHERLGPGRCRCITAVSPSLAGAEAEDCRSLAADWGLEWTTVVTTEMESAAYRRNDPDRCFHCKSALMDALGPLAESTGATVVLGVNCDDLGDHRPGQTAAAEAGARFPLVEAGFTKADVRAASAALGLRTWDKPAAACLASRIPYGTEVTVAILGRIERAEAVLHQLGFAQVRVRHVGDTARIEVEADRIADLGEYRDVIVDGFARLGFAEVVVDVEGFRSGKLNGPLPAAVAL